MAIQPINNDPTLSNLPRTTPAGQTVDAQRHELKKKNATGDSVAFVASGEAQSDIARIDSTKEAIASAARSIRAANTAMNAIGDNLVKMKQHLEGIVKNFPPFPQGSDERMKLLKSYNSLRKQIDALTVPPPPPDGTEYARIVGDPAIGGSGGIKVTTERGDVVTINAQEVHTGPTGLNIPELPDADGNDATDEQIYHAINSIDTAVQILGDKRSGLTTDAMKLLG